MRNSVTQVQSLLGARLRDSRHRRLGRIVGVDQTRDLPALLIVWEGQMSPERVSLSAEELRELVGACVAAQPAPAIETLTVAEVDAATYGQQRMLNVGGR